MRYNFVTNQLNKTKLTGYPVHWKKFNTTWQNKIFKNCEQGTGGDNTTRQTFGTVNARYLRNGTSQIHRSYKKLLTHITTQNRRMEEKLFQNLEGVAGGRPH